MLSICDYASYTILNSLKVNDVIIRYIIRQGVTIVYTRCNKGLDYSYKCFLYQKCFKQCSQDDSRQLGVLVWHLNKLVKDRLSRFVTDPIGIIEDSHRNLIQRGDAKYIIFVLVSFNLWKFWLNHSQISVLNSSRKRRNLTHYQEPVIYTAVHHQHTSDI